MESRRERVARHARESRADARAKKLCQLCPKKRRHPVRPGKSTCFECAAANAKRQRRVILEQKQKGLCAKYRCPNPRGTGSLCAEHDRTRRSYPSNGRNVTVKRRRAENLCREGCGNSAFDKTQCSECSELGATKAILRREERIAAGLCYRCGKNKAPPNKGCRSCVRERRVGRHDRRSTPVPRALRRCGACGEYGHRKSSRACPKWKPSR